MRAAVYVFGFGSTTTDGRDFVDGGDGIDTFVLTSTSPGSFSSNSNINENFDIWTRAAAGNAFGPLNAATEIIVTRNGSVAAELANVEELVINTGDGTDTVTVHGNFDQTHLMTSTITINDGDGGDTVDITDLSSEHRVVFHTDTNGHFIGDPRPQDVFDTSNANFIDPDSNDTGSQEPPNAGTDTDTDLDDDDDDQSLPVAGNAPVAPTQVAGLVLTGDDAANTLVGDEGNDLAFGGGGNDNILGGGGNDMLFGDAGADRIFGGDLETMSSRAAQVATPSLPALATTGSSPPAGTPMMSTGVRRASTRSTTPPSPATSSPTSAAGCWVMGAWSAT